MYQAAVTNIVVSGLGGQGVLTATDVIAWAAFLAGYDVKKSEVHGMSQRGGSVVSDVRFGAQVFSPMVPEGEADYLVLLDPGQLEPCRSLLRPGGLLIEPGWIETARLPARRSLNVALAGALSVYLPIPEPCWETAILRCLRASLREANLAAFRVGRQAAQAINIRAHQEHG